MPTLGASAIIFTEDRQRVLMIKRADFRVWVLPGGGIEPGETPEQAAIRETREETGYEIAIDRLVAKYWHPQSASGGNRRDLFEGHIVGGAAIKQGDETLAVGFFSVDAMPSQSLGWVKTFVADALAKSPTVIERTLTLPVWRVILLRVAIVLRDFHNKHILRRK